MNTSEVISSWIVDGLNQQRLEADLRLVYESRSLLEVDIKKRTTRTKKHKNYLYQLHLKNINNNERCVSNSTSSFTQNQKGEVIMKENINNTIKNSSSKLIHALMSNLLENFHWDEITWIDCEGLFQIFLSSNLNTRRLTLYRISPPPTPDAPSLIMPPEPKADDSEIAKGSPPTRIMYQNNNRCIIQELNLEHCVLDVKATKHLSSFIGGAENLITFSVKSCFWLENQETCINNIIEGLESRRCRHLRRRGSNDDTLKNIIFFWSNIHDNQIARIISSLPPSSNVDSSDLSGNLCRKQGMVAIAEHWLQLGSTTTNEKKKSMLRLREQCIDIDSKLDIRPLLLNNLNNSRTILNSLLHLDVSVNRLTDDDMILLSDVAASSSSTTTTVSSSSPPADETKRPETPPSQMVLQILDVRSNNITDIGVNALCRISSLRQIHLQDNEGITHKGAYHLYNSAKLYGNLEVVGLSQRFDNTTNFGDSYNTTRYDNDDSRSSSSSSSSEEEEGGDRKVDDCDHEHNKDDVQQIQILLDYYTMLNWGGRRLLMEEKHGGGTSSSSLPSSLPLSVWPVVLERASKQDGIDRSANILFYLLRWGPILWEK